MILCETSAQKQERENVTDELHRKSERIAEVTGEPREYIDQFTSTQLFELVQLPDGHLAVKGKL